MSRDVRWWLVATAVLFALGELIDGIAYGIPPGIVFAVVVGGAAWWASRSGSWVAPALLEVLALVELLMVLFVYGHGKDAAAWWRLVLFGVLSFAVAALAAVELTAASRRRSEPGRSAA
jgi:hypothetical protein